MMSGTIYFYCLTYFINIDLGDWYYRFVRTLLQQACTYHFRPCSLPGVPSVGIQLPPRKLIRLLPRKEVIQPHLPVRLPCYDFVPVTGPALGGCFLTVSAPTLGVTNSHDVTGG